MTETCIEQFHQELNAWTAILQELQSKGISVKRVRAKIEQIIQDHDEDIEHIEIREV